MSHFLSNKTVAALLVSCFAFVAPLKSFAQDKPLQLEVFVNEEPMKLIASFRQDANGKLFAKAKELREIGLLPQGARSEEEEVALESLQGVSFTLDTTTQTLRVTASDASRVTRRFTAQEAQSEGKALQNRDFGAVMNYSLFSATARDFQRAHTSFSGVSATLDARVFGPLGTFAQSGLIGNATNFVRRNDIRLDSTWSYSDENTMVTTRVGDFISGGVAWSRPIRMGGFQAQRNFGLRSDLITHALPSASGTAAVPSTVDVYVNNVRSHSQDVPSGPFQISNLPVAGSNGTARIVVRDVSGRTSETTQNFFVSPQIMAKGLFDYSLEGGYARHDYGLQSFSYHNRFAAQGSARYGLGDNFTLEAHGEASSRFGLLGGGFTTALEKRHLVSLAASFSAFEEKKGGLFFASYETNFKGFFLALSTQRTLGDYYDLAAVTAQPAPLQTLNSVNPFTLPSLGGGALVQTALNNPFAMSQQPMKAVDRASLSIPLENTRASLNFSHLHMLNAQNQRAHISSASFNMVFNDKTSLFATAFMERGDRRNYGFYAGLSMQLGEKTFGHLGVSKDNASTYASAELSRPQAQEVDTWGYRIRALEGQNMGYRTAQASYRSQIGLGEVTLSQQNKGIYATAYVEGGIAVAGGGVFASNRMDEGFAVVKTGVKNAKVFQENRPVGETDKYGRLLIPALRSNESNRISLDPNSLPLSASIATTKTLAMPKDRGAVVVDFGVNETPNAALIRFRDKQGKPLALGAQGVRDNGASFTLGHDGQAYLSGLNPQNTVRFENEKYTCQASFSFVAENETQTKIDATCI